MVTIQKTRYMYPTEKWIKSEVTKVVVEKAEVPSNSKRLKQVKKSWLRIKVTKKT